MPVSTISAVLRTWTSSRKLAAVVLLVALVVLGIGALSHRGSSPSLAESAGTDVSTKEPGGGGDFGGSVRSDSAAVSSTGIQGDSNAGPHDSLPVKAAVLNTTGLRAGDEVTIAVQASRGSAIYAVEMRVCKAGTIIRNEGDMLPTVSGRCAAHPLSAGASGFLQVPGAPPYREMVAAYKVGVGTDTFPLDEGGTASVTCDHDHPCVLAVKFQIPNGFGFRTYPLTFA